MYVNAYFHILLCSHGCISLLFVSVPAFLEKVAVVLIWGGSVFVCQLVGYWLGLGGLLWVVGFSDASKILLVVILNSSFRCLLFENLCK